MRSLDGPRVTAADFPIADAKKAAEAAAAAKKK